MTTMLAVNSTTAASRGIKVEDGLVVFPFRLEYTPGWETLATPMKVDEHYSGNPGRTTTLHSWLVWLLGRIPMTHTHGSPIGIQTVSNGSYVLWVISDVVMPTAWGEELVFLEQVDLFDLLLGMPEARPLGFDAFLFFDSKTTYIATRDEHGVNFVRIIDAGYLTDPYYYAVKPTPKPAEPVEVKPSIAELSDEDLILMIEEED
ncbi:MAG TPA: hypothetical protein VIY48_10450 [Candidatus Paceibacterota bacterium]